MVQKSTLLVVGGGLAGVATLEALALQEAAAGATLITKEPYLPYDRPPLSKDLLLGLPLSEKRVAERLISQKIPLHHAQKALADPDSSLEDLLS